MKKLNNNLNRLMLIKWTDCTQIGSQSTPEKLLEEKMMDVQTVGFGQILNDRVIIVPELLEADDIIEITCRDASIIPIQNIKEIMFLNKGKSIKYTNETR